MHARLASNIGIWGCDCSNYGCCGGGKVISGGWSPCDGVWQGIKTAIIPSLQNRSSERRRIQIDDTRIGPYPGGSPSTPYSGKGKICPELGPRTKSSEVFPVCATIGQCNNRSRVGDSECPEMHILRCIVQRITNGSATSLQSLLGPGLLFYPILRRKGGKWKASRYELQLSMRFAKEWHASDTPLFNR